MEERGRWRESDPDFDPLIHPTVYSLCKQTINSPVHRMEEGWQADMETAARHKQDYSEKATVQ